MEVAVSSWVALSLVFVSILIRWAWGVLNWLWLKPKKLERCLRGQGLKGNSYRLFYGDMKENSVMLTQAKSKPMNLSSSHDIASRFVPFLDQTVKTYGKNSFVWIGPIPRVNIMDPEDVKDVFTKLDDFRRPATNPLIKLLITGIASYEDEKWAKHRRIINPTFHAEKLKTDLSLLCASLSFSLPNHHLRRGIDLLQRRVLAEIGPEFCARTEGRCFLSSRGEASAKI